MNNPTNTLKKAGAVFFLGLILVLFLFESLNKAYNKDFWGDEATDIFTTLIESPAKMFTGSAVNQQSGSPLYYMAQHEFIEHALQHERNTGKGFDWRITFRLIPILSIFVALIFFVYMLRNIMLWPALLSAAFLTTYSQTIWYAAETRIYASWLAASLIFYAASIRIWMSRERINKLIFLFSIFLCTGIAITSPVFIVTTCFLMLTDTFLRAKKIRHTLITGAIFSFILFKFWNVSRAPFSWTYFSNLSYYVTHFLTRTLDMTGGVRGTLECFFFVGVLYFQKRSKLYRGIAIIGAGFLLAALFTYIAQIGVGYFFSERHVIFTLAARAILKGTAIAYLIEILWSYLRIQTFFKNNKWALATLICFFALFDWAKWGASHLNRTSLSLEKFVKPYCHGAVMIESLADEPTLLNVSNVKRHSGECIDAKEISGVRKPSAPSQRYFFNPTWIYQGP